MMTVAGLDLGQSVDHAALVVADAQPAPLSVRVNRVRQYPIGTSYAVILPDVATTLSAMPEPIALAVDARGPGKPCVDMLAAWSGRDQAGPELIPRPTYGLNLARLLAVSNTSGKVSRREPSRPGDPPHLERWCVPKITLFHCLSRLIKSGGLNVSDTAGADLLKGEFQNFGFRFTEAGNLKLDARTGHDDLLLATSILIWAAITQGVA